MSYRILTLNHISVRGLERLPRDRYEVASQLGHPHAVLVRSADMHQMALPDSLLAVARAGAAVSYTHLDVYKRQHEHGMRLTELGRHLVAIARQSLEARCV